MVTVVGVFRERPDRDEDQVVGAEVHAAFGSAAYPADAGGLLPLRGDVEVDIGDLGAEVEHHALVQQPPVQRQDQRFVLVVLRELQRREVRQAADVVDEAVQVQLHLQRAVPLLEGEHGAPVKPEVAREELVAEHLVDALVLHLLTGGEEDLHDLLLRLRAEAEHAVGVRVLAAVHGGALQRVVRVVLVQPVELVQHARALDLDRRDGPEQVPQALEVILHLPAAADHEALLRLLDAVQRPAGQREPLEDRDLRTWHLAVADQERGPGQRRQSRAHEPCRLVLHTLGLPRPRERLVIAAAVVHGRSRLLCSCPDYADRARQVRGSLVP